MTTHKSLEQLEAEGWSRHQLALYIDALEDDVDFLHSEDGYFDHMRYQPRRYDFPANSDPATIDASRSSRGIVERQLGTFKGGYDLSDLDPQSWSADQMYQHYIAQRYGICFTSAVPESDWMEAAPRRHDGRRFAELSPEWIGGQMRQQRYALQKGLDISSLDPGDWSAHQMEEQRFALERGYDISHLDPYEETWIEMIDEAEQLHQEAGFTQSVTTQRQTQPSRGRR